MVRKQTVIVFGTFDLLHPGHISYLGQAKHYGDWLVAVIARDKTIKQFKGFYPLFNEKERLHIISQLKLVDKAILGDLQNPYKVLKLIKPDIICLGYDQNLFVNGIKDYLQKNKIKMKIVRIKPFRPFKYKSSRYKNL